MISGLRVLYHFTDMTTYGTSNGRLHAFIYIGLIMLLLIIATVLACIVTFLDFKIQFCKKVDDDQEDLFEMFDD